jgi:uncharacterized protein YceK
LALAFHPPFERGGLFVYSADLDGHACPRRCVSPSMRVLCIFCLLALTLNSGCSRIVPGESFSAGYIFPDKQSKVIHDFVVKNTTSEPVNIRAVEKTCSCTSFKLGKYQLAPGEATTLMVEVDVINSYLQKFARCTLKTDHHTFKDWAYTVTFVSLPFVVAEPAVLNIGSFTVDGRNADAINHATIDLYADSKIELTHDNFILPEEINLEISSGPESRQLQRGVWNTRYELSIGLSNKGRETIIHNVRSDINNKFVQLRTGGPNSRSWQYSIYWRTLASLESHPSVLSFGNLSDDRDDHCRSITISSTIGGKFRIVTTKSQSQHIRVESYVDTAGEESQHRLRFKAIGQGSSNGPMTDGPSRRFLSGTIQVQTTDKIRPVLDIPWSAIEDTSVKPHSRAGQPALTSVRP